jgi:short-subunit dehydrogenase
MKNLYNDKNCLIIGGSSGLGLSIAEDLIKQKANIIIAGKSKEKLENIIKKYKFNYEKTLEVFHVNLEKEDSFKMVSPKINSIFFKKIDYIFYCAGTNLIGKVQDIKFNQLNKIFKINCFGMIETFKTFLPLLQKNINSKFIYISSGSASYGTYSQGVYSASKVAVERIIESLRFETNVSFIIINPGVMNTKFIEKSERINNVRYLGEGKKGISTSVVSKAILKNINKNNFFYNFSLITFYIKLINLLLPKTFYSVIKIISKK